MTAEVWRCVLLVATIVGAGVTIWGLVSAYLGAGREYRQADLRLTKMHELGEAEERETAERERSYVSSAPSDPGQRAAFDKAKEDEDHRRRAHWEEQYRALDMVRPTYGNMVELAAFESKRLLGLLLNSTRRDFLIAGLGLVVSTLASAGSLFLAG